MTERLVGKPSPTRLHALLQGSLGSPSSAVLLGPGPGLDAAILDIGNGTVMAIAEDPIFPAPGLPLEMMGWFTVHIGASDVAVTGIRPRFMTYTLLLPGTAPEADARLLIQSISRTAAELGISIVGGHTGWYDAVSVPIVGGVTVWGSAPRDAWVSPAGARDGDLMLMTKGPAVEATALLAVLYSDRLRTTLDPSILAAACARASQITVVQDALTAFATGGVHAMHDATEGGVLGGLWEMSAASGLNLRADLDPVEVPADIAAVAKALQFDPWAAISEGTLLAASPRDRADSVMAVWQRMGVDSWVIGQFDASLPHNTVRRDGATGTLREPEKDPFWDLFFAGLQGSG